MNTMRLTMSFTTGNDDPTWFNRLPIIGSRTTSMSFRKAEPSESSNEKISDGGPFMSGLLSRASTRGRDENGRISTEVPRRRYDGTGRPVGGVGLISPQPQPLPQAVLRDQDQIETYREGRNLIFEDEQGDVVAQSRTPIRHFDHHSVPLELDSKAVAEKLKHPTRHHTSDSDHTAPESPSKHKPAMAFRFDDNIIVEDEDGEVIKRYKIPKAKKTTKNDVETGHTSTVNKGSIFKNWFGFKESADDDPDFGLITDDEGDMNLGGQNIRLRDAKGRKLSKQQFIHELKMMDPHARRAMISQSSFFPEDDTNGGPSRKEKLAEMKSDMEKVVEGLSPLTTEDSVKTIDGERVVSHHGQGSPHLRATGRARISTLENEEEETTVERRRREAALGISGEETSAERRRREAALGIASEGSEDSDDDGAPRIPRQRATMEIGFAAQEQDPKQGDTPETESNSNNGSGTEGDSAMNDNGPGTGASTPGRLIQFAEDPKGKQRQS